MAAPALPVVLDLADLPAQAGRVIGPGPWHVVDGEQVDRFAGATGLLALSMVPMLQAELRRFTGVAMAVNYGLEQARFPAPVQAGAQIRLTLTLLDADPRADGSTLLRSEARVELAEVPDPALVAETLTILRPARA